jgi:hypothetical protein
VFLRGPAYRPIWVSVGLDLVAGVAEATVRTAVDQALRQFLSPLPDPSSTGLSDPALLLGTPQYAAMQKGWPLRKSVVALELLAVASRVPGVSWVTSVLIAPDGGAPLDTISMVGLQLPRIAGLSVVAGDPVPLADLQGSAIKSTTKRVPVPVIPENC